MEFALSYSLSSSSISFLVFFARLFKLFGLVFPSLSSSISFIIFLYSSISSRVLFVPTPLITSMIGCFSSSVVSGSSFEGSSASGTIFSSGISSGIPGVVSAFSFSSTGDIFSSPPLSPSSITLAFSSKRVSSLCNLGDSSFNVVGNSSSSSGPSGPPRVSSSTLSASSFNSDERDSRFSGSSSIISSSIFLCRLSSSFLPLTISPLSAPISSLSFSVISSTGSFSESLGTSGTEEGIGIFSGIFL